MKKLFGSFLFVLLVLLVFVFTGCVYYSYATKNDNYADGFEALLNNGMPEDEGFYIRLTHLSYTRNYNMFYSGVTIYPNKLNQKIEIGKSSVRINHIYNNSVLEVITHSQHDEILQKEKGNNNFYIFKQSYKGSTIKSNWKEIKEVVHIEFMVDGKPYIVDREFTLIRKKHYTIFDIWMSV